MADMTKRERIQAALGGGPVDRVPVAFWRHWPGDDQNAESLAQRAIEFQRKYDWDFIKVPPSHTYVVDDYGVKHAYRGRSIGDRDHLEPLIKRVEDLDRIEPLDVRKGTYGEQLRCLRMVLEARDPEVPVIYTCFNPLNLFRYLFRKTGEEESYVVHLRRHPKRVHLALEALTETCVRFVETLMAQGADGIFLSTTGASYRVMTEDEYRTFGRPGDLAMLRAAASGWFNVMHICGRDPMFAQFADYPVHAVNWHDRAEGPSLAEAAQTFPGALVGGVEQHNVLQFGTPADVEAQVHDAIRETGGRGLIVAAGCTFKLTVPEGNLHAARRAVETASMDRFL